MSGTDLEVPETLDANPPPEDVARERPLTAREEIMARINARREEQIQTENAQAAIYDADAREAGLAFPEDEPELTESEPVAQVTRAGAPPPRITPSLAQSAPPSPVAPSVRSVTIDGQQYTVTEDQADQLMRLGMMANVALHQYQQPAQPSAPPPEQPRSVIDDERIAETVRQMQYGGEDAAREALKSLITDVVARVPVPQIDQNAIVARAVQEARAQSQLITDGDLIRQEYPDIFSDPQRTMLAKLNVDAIRARDVATGTRRSDLEIYREAGDAVYNALGRSKEPPQPVRETPSPARQDRIERKRNAPRATQPIDLRAPSPAAPRPPSGSDVVEQIRLRRGQPSMR